MRGEKALFLLLTVLCCLPARAQYRCGAARDLVVQAIENLKGSGQKSDVEDGVELIKHAEQTCPTMGDVWYYRSLFEDRLAQMEDPSGASEAARRHHAVAASSQNKAKLFGSQALDDGLTPFQLAAPPQPQLAIGPVQQKWALVIGIGKFHGNADALPYSSKDARDVAALLKDPHLGRFKEDHVELLTDEHATLSNIKAGLNKIARQAGPSDLVLVFVASHGTSRAQDKVGHLNYVLAYDSDSSNEDQLYGSSLPMTDISEVIRSRIKALRTVVLLDTCHSEGGGKGLLHGAAASQDMMDNMKAGVGRALIAASAEKQRSYDSDTFENGVFTHFFMEGLKKQDGKMPLSAIFEYVAQEVPKQVATEQKAEQTPVMFRSEQGSDIVIGVEPAMQTAASNTQTMLDGPGSRQHSQ